MLIFSTSVRQKQRFSEAFLILKYQSGVLAYFAKAAVAGDYIRAVTAIWPHLMSLGMSSISIRPAEPGDISAITRIYAHAVEYGTASFERGVFSLQNP
jgi:hypothetical protein